MRVESLIIRDGVVHEARRAHTYMHQRKHARLFSIGKGGASLSYNPHVSCLDLCASVRGEGAFVCLCNLMHKSYYLMLWCAVCTYLVNAPSTGMNMVELLKNIAHLLKISTYPYTV